MANKDRVNYYDSSESKEFEENLNEELKEAYRALGKIIEETENPSILVIASGRFKDEYKRDDSEGRALQAIIGDDEAIVESLVKLNRKTEHFRYMQDLALAQVELEKASVRTLISRSIKSDVEKSVDDLIEILKNGDIAKA